MMIRMIHSLGCVLALTFVGAATAQAALELQYDVAIVDNLGNPLAGPVPVGTEIFWQISAVISGTPTEGQNRGIAQVSTNLTVTAGETLTPGTIGTPFTMFGAYLTSGGTPLVPPDELNIINASQITQNDFTTVGANGNPGSFLLASGSYIAANPGLHTLMTTPNVDDHLYFTAAGQGLGAASMYENVMFDSASILVGVPEPSSLALMALAACAALALRLRHRKIPNSPPMPTT